MAHSSSRYLFVGGVSFVVDLGVLAVLHSLVRLPLSAATTLAFATGLVINFGLNRTFAFRSQSRVRPAFIRYLMLVGVNYIMTLGIVVGLTSVLFPYPVAKTAATMINACFNYLAYRWWIFRQ